MRLAFYHKYSNKHVGRDTINKRKVWYQPGEVAGVGAREGVTDANEAQAADAEARAAGLKGGGNQDEL